MVVYSYLLKIEFGYMRYFQVQSNQNYNTIVTFTMTTSMSIFIIRSFLDSFNFNFIVHFLLNIN